MNHPASHSDDGLHLAPMPWEGLQVNHQGLQAAELHTALKSEIPAQAYHEDEEEQRRPQRRKVCGLNPPTFWLALVIAILLIGIAIGGGVGGSLASKNKTKDATATTTQSSSSSSSSSQTLFPTHPSTTTSLTATPTATASCTANNTIVTATNGDTYLKYCETDLDLGKDYIWGALLDTVHVPSLEACIDACANWNLIGVEGGGCASVTWAFAGHGFSSCWLKNTTGHMVPSAESNSAVVHNK